METLRYVLLANGLLIVVSVAFYLLLRRETFFNTNRLMLWLGVLSVLVLPALQFPDWRPQRVRSAMQHTARVIAPSVLPRTPVAPPVTITFPNGRSYPVTPARRLARFGWSWQLALIGLYLVGVGSLFIRFLVQLVSIRRLVHRSARQPYDTFTLVTNPVVDAPFSFFRWIVLNPARHTGDELEQILRHERVHVRQRHSVDMLMAEGVCIVFWMNPAAYLFRKLVHQTLEFCADQAVLAEGIDARSYQYNLLKVSLASGTTPIVNSFSTSQLRDRIRMMNRQRSRWFKALNYPVVMVLSLAVVTAFARHKAEQIATQVAEPVVQSFVAEPVKNIKIYTNDLPLTTDSLVELNNSKVRQDSLEQSVVTVSIDSSEIARTDSIYHSDSKLVAYQEDVLHWVITPRTTLDEFNVLQRELAKHGCKLQLREIKYNPGYQYIDRIDITVIEPGSGMTAFRDTVNDNGNPIKAIAGHLSVGSRRGHRGIGTVDDYALYFPEELKSLASIDTKSAAIFVGSDPESALAATLSKLRGRNLFSTRYDQLYFDNKSTKSSGILVKADKSLVVDNDCRSASIYINNEPVDAEAINLWTVDKLYAVVKRSSYDPVSKHITPVALLLYTTNK